MLHTDLSRRFPDVAKTSYALSRFPVDRKDLQARGFWSFVRGAKLQGERFDVVILDPSFFSTTPDGKVDLNRGTTRLVNKVRPLVRSGGTLVVVNNARFLSGAAFLAELEALCAGGWMTIERTIDDPEDVTGFPATRRGPVTPHDLGIWFFAHEHALALLGTAVGPGYQTRLAAGVRAGAGTATATATATATVGMITERAQADQMIRNSQADVVALGRALVREPSWPLCAAHEQGVDARWRQTSCARGAEAWLGRPDDPTDVGDGRGPTHLRSGYSAGGNPARSAAVGMGAAPLVPPRPAIVCEARGDPQCSSPCHQSLSSRLRWTLATGLLLGLAAAHAPTLSRAIPIVMASTGLQPADIERLERETCSGDYADATLAELRAGNRDAVWLVEIHLAALHEMLPAP